MSETTTTSAKENGNGDAADEKQWVKQSKPIQKRALYAAAAFSIQNLVAGPFTALRNTKQRLSPSEINPTLVKSYPVRPKLPLRIFFPRSYDRTSPRPMPLLFSIHGGGFVIGDASDNDAFNSIFSNKHTALVVALNYQKAPANPYPGPRLDLVALIDAVFSDPELTPHFDKAKVGMTGFSAGGGLCMTTSMVPSVREKLTAGVIPVYPILDFAKIHAQKTETRRYKPSLGGARARATDPLKSLAVIFDWAYVPVGQDLKDPFLSPYYAQRDDFPRRVWFVGCELDMLGHEAWRAACKFSGRPIPGMDQPLGREEVVNGGKAGSLITEGDERFAFSVKDEHGEIKWLCVADAGHGFDMAASMGGDAATIEDGILKRNALIDMAGEWLFGQS